MFSKSFIEVKQKFPTGETNHFIYSYRHKDIYIVNPASIMQRI